MKIGAWCARGLAEEDIVRLILDGTVIETRLGRRRLELARPPGAADPNGLAVHVTPTVPGFIDGRAADRVSVTRVPERSVVPGVLLHGLSCDAGQT